MHFFARYVAYLKHNPEGYWFKRKVWGWGWVPARWQGWLSLLILIAAFVLILVPFVSNPAPTPADIGRFAACVLLWIGAIIALCYLTGEPPRWQWGLPAEDAKPDQETERFGHL